MSRVLSLFRHLTAVPTAPYFEQGVERQALSWIKKNLGAKVTVQKRRGGLVVRYQGRADAPFIAFAAHTDHPAFRLSGVTQRGAKAQLEGGLPSDLLDGVVVEAFRAGASSNAPAAVGRLGKTPKDVTSFTVAWLRPPKGKVDFAVLKLPACRVKGGWLSSRSIDDILGCAVSLEALRRLAVSRAKTNVAVILHRAEEVGFMGALDIIRRGEFSLEDSVISVESSRAIRGALPGRGAVVRTGDKACAFDPNLISLLDAAARAVKGRTQRQRLTGGTCEATAYLAFGYEAAGVAVPLVNYHNGWGAKAVAAEKVRVSDVDGAVALLEEAGRRFPETLLRGLLRRRLVKRHRENRTLL